jgi:hypothetical protein
MKQYQVEPWQRLLSWFIFRPLRFTRYLPSKRLLTFNWRYIPGYRTLYILFITEIHSIRPDSSINRGVFTLRRLYSVLNSSELQELFYCLHIATCRRISRIRFSEEIRFLEANQRWVLNTCFLGYANERCRFCETNTSLWNQQAFSFKRTFNKHFLGCRFTI